jgi:ribonuclease BN (tRNA processing enzyme)
MPQVASSQVAEPADHHPGRGGTLTVLGCDGSYPGPGGAASGYLVEAGGVRVWLDAGAGTFAKLQLVADPAHLDALVLSHEHPDHWSDLESFAVWLLHAQLGRPVPVYAPPGLRARTYFGHHAVFAWHDLDPSELLVLEPGEPGEPGTGGLSCRFSVTDHGPVTLAVRFDPVVLAGAARAEGVPDPASSLAYTADTGPDWSVAELGAGIGTVLCEATHTRRHEGELRHLSGRQAGVMAASAGAGRLVLTHRLPTVPAEVLGAEAGSAMGRPVLQAEPGLVLDW